jgi:excisionase family DNA binding protein
MALEKMYSVPEAAEVLGISTWTIYAYLSSGKLQRSKIGSRTVVRESSLAKLVEDGGKSRRPGKRA